MVLSSRVIAFTFFCLAALLWFNLSGRPLESELQVEFNKWSETTVQHLRNNQRIDGLQVEATVKNADQSTKKFSLPILNLDLAQSNNQLIRIIELAKEANIFSADQSVRESTPSAILTIKDPNNTFSTTIPNSYLDQNIKAGNLFKLFELFSSSQPGGISTSTL